MSYQKKKNIVKNYFELLHRIQDCDTMYSVQKVVNNK